MEPCSCSDLSITFNEETNTVTFEWDSNTHPEYDFVRDLTSEGLAEICNHYLKKLNNEKAEKADQTRGSCSRTPES